MTPNKLKEILQKGESICAFLNWKGDHLLLGIKNDGTAEGVTYEDKKMIHVCVPESSQAKKYLTRMKTGILT